MVKFNQTQDNNESCRAYALLFALNIFMLVSLESVDASDRRNDIILTKGKLIMRGEKGKGNIILDTGSKASEHHGHAMMMPMMPMMGHHFNPYSFYPMQQHHHEHEAPPKMMIHPVYIEDHSALHHHGGHHEQPEQHHYEHHQHDQQYEHHHEEPQQHYQHHGMEHHYEHQPHVEHHEPEHHHEEEQQHHHHEPMMGHHYEGHEGHHEEQHGGYETHPMMTMMSHGSGLRPTYEQLAAMQAFQRPMVYETQPQVPHHADQLQEAQQQQQLVQLNQLNQHQQQLLSQQLLNQQNQQQQQEAQKETASSNANPSAASTNQKHYGGKITSTLLGQSANNPLAAIIKPLFKWNPLADKKKPQN